MGRFEHLELSDGLPRSKGAPPPNAGPNAGPNTGPEADSGIVDGDTYVAKADATFNEEDFERALAYYSRALQYDIAIPHAWAGQIRCLIELNELPEAITWADRALEKFPESPEVLAARGVAESRFGRHETALGFVDAALSAPGVTSDVWVARGDVLIPINIANARRCFVKAQEIATDKVQAQTAIARAMCAHGCWHLALEPLRSVVHDEPGNARSWFWLGRCYEELGDLDEAGRCYVRALAANPRLKPAQDAAYRLNNTNAFAGLARRVRRLFHRQN